MLNRLVGLFAAGWLAVGMNALGGCAVGLEDDAAFGSGGNKPASNPSKSGVCRDSCPRTCGGDNDCDKSKGQMCCDLGGGESICTAAKACPRFCENDHGCKTDQGQGCMRVTLASPKKVCTTPSAGLKLCSGDQQCGTNEVCCGIYNEGVCLPANLCPKTCGATTECNTGAGEVCCTTLAMKDSSLRESGLCVNPSVVPCPTACTSSSNCDNAKGEVCCAGICSTSCSQSCEQSNECDGQVCCKASLVASPWIDKPPALGFKVVTTPPTKGPTSGAGGGSSSCAHSPCQQGAKLYKYCSSCVTTVCNYDSYCCTGGWDNTCVQLALQYCGDC